MSQRFVLPLRSKIAAGLATALLVLAVGAMSLWMVLRAAHSFEEVNHSSGVLLEQQKLIRALVDAETAARGYAISGDSSFVDPFDSARLSVPGTIARLRAMMADHPLQLPRLDTLESIANLQIDLNAQLIRMRKEQGFANTARLIQSGQGKMVMDRARTLAGAMESEENHVLAIRAQRQERDQNLAYFVIGVGGGLAFLLSILINRGIRVDVIEREGQRVVIEKQTREMKRQAQRLAIQRSESQALARQMTALLESTEAGFYGMDREGNCTFVNAAGARMLGYEVEELNGVQLHQAIHYKHHDGRPYLLEECPIFNASQRGESAAADNEVFWKKDGTPLPVEYSTSPIMDEGEHRGAVVAFADITARLAAQRALKESEERKASILRSTLDCIITMTADGKVMEFNPAAEKAFGYTRQEAVGQALGELIVPERYRQAHIAGLARYVKSGEAHVIGQRLELPAMRKDGSEFLSELTITRNEWEGAPTFTGVLRDISERKQQEAEREQLIKALARSNQELDQFAYVASHDLKAPLRGIANLSQWIEEDLGDNLKGENKSQMEMLRGRVHRMEALIDGILQYSRAGRVKAKPETIDTAALVGEVIELIAPPPGIRISIAEGMPSVRAEKVPLQQVFMNLVGNAVKHAGANEPRIEISWADAGPFYEFWIKDNGPGIAEQYHERIFGIFQTLEARDKVEGTGIGLSVVQKIVEGKGGKVWVESGLGRGAKFAFLWPKAE